MPFAFVLPTTSAFSFASAFTCPSHPSLLRNASTYRGVVRDTLKKHKRLPPEAQSANLTLVVASLQDYLPYLLTLVDGRVSLSGPEGSSPAAVAGQLPEWRPTLAVRALPGRREAARVRVRSLDQELAFVLASLGHALTLQARAVLQPLYVTASIVPVGPQQRLAAITAATRHLLDAASVLTFAAQRAETTPSMTPDISPPVLRAHAALALAEATLLAVLKDDPYPAVVAQDRNENDREWMYKAPDIPKVRAHLFARLCLAAADHAAAAHAGCSAISGSAYARYLEDLRHTSRAKACRFFALDAELGGQTGTALAWLRAARDEVGTGSDTGLSLSLVDGSSAGSRTGSHLLSRLRKERSEKREDRRVERGLNWGADAGRLEESRVLEMLEAKWTKQNDTMNTQRIPPSAPLLAQMPSGREIHAVKPFDPPALDAAVLETMRVPPDPLDEAEAEADVHIGADDSSDDDTLAPSSSAASGRQYF